MRDRRKHHRRTSVKKTTSPVVVIKLFDMAFWSKSKKDVRLSFFIPLDDTDSPTAESIINIDAPSAMEIEQPQQCQQFSKS